MDFDPSLRTGSRSKTESKSNLENLEMNTDLNLNRDQWYN